MALATENPLILLFMDVDFDPKIDFDGPHMESTFADENDLVVGDIR